MRRSLRFRLTAGMLGSTAVLLGLFGAWVYLTLRHSLLAEFDGSLTATARALAASVDVDEEEIEVEVDPARLAQLQEAGHRIFFQFWTDGGVILARSQSLGATGLPRFHGEDQTPTIRELTLTDGPLGGPKGLPTRAAGLRFVPAHDEDVDDEDDRRAARESARQAEHVVLVLAMDASSLHARLGFLLGLMLAGGAGTMLVALGICIVIVGRGLRPLTAVAGRIAAIGEEDLSVRLPTAHLPDEIRPVVERLNGLLGRLESAFARERTFTANVAHELRTPLAGVRSTIEVALTRQRDSADYREALDDCLQIATQMQSMVERLLVLARLEAGEMEFRRESVNLSELLDACWQPLSERAAGRGLTCERHVPAGLTCSGDRELLAMAVANLFENAIEYADDGGRITADAQRTADAVEIRIANSGAVLTAEQAAHVFEPFWRADDARRDTGLHCGLGLALVRRIATSLGGRATADVDDDGVFTVRIHLSDAETGHQERDP